MSPELITAVAVALLGGGLLGGIALLLRVRPEAGQVVVKSAESVVIMQKGFIESLTDQVKTAQAELVTLRTVVNSQQSRLDELAEELSSTRSQRDRLLRENGELKAEVAELRARVAQLENGTGGT